MYVNIFFSSFSVDFQHFLAYPIDKVNMYTFLVFLYYISLRSSSIDFAGTSHKESA